MAGLLVHLPRTLFAAEGQVSRAAVRVDGQQPTALFRSVVASSAFRLSTFLASFLGRAFPSFPSFPLILSARGDVALEPANDLSLFVIVVVYLPPPADSLASFLGISSMLSPKDMAHIIQSTSFAAMQELDAKGELPTLHGRPKVSSKTY